MKGTDIRVSWVGLLLASNFALAQAPAFQFKDATQEAGLLPNVAGIRGHGVAWGDSRGTGWPDLFVASFHDAGSKPGMFFTNDRGRFTLDSQEHLRTSGMGSGALFVDLTNSGRLDLFVSTCATNGKTDSRKQPSYLFRNDGEGRFRDISKSSGIQIPNFAGRGLAALDADGDGLLDLLVAERYYGKVEHGPALFRNRGDYRLVNESAASGLPAQFSTLGLAIADLNDDGWPDVVLSEGEGNHRIYLNDNKGKFTECLAARKVLQWTNLGREDTPAGVTVADLNRDGLPDLVIGQHFKAPWQKPAAFRVYLHRGVKEGQPTFEDVTEAIGIKPLAMKAPHLEIQDFDNDGWPDIATSIVKFKNGEPYPILYRNRGIKNGLPQFEEINWGINDFPNSDDLASKNAAALFDKLIKDQRIMYMAAAPACDYNRDGKVDLFLANWWIESPSRLLKNETAGGHWLDVRVEGTQGVNRMGIGAKIKVYPAGELGKPNSLLGYREIAIGYGFCSGQEAVAHFGLGKVDKVDIEVILPHDRGTIVKKQIKVDQRLTIKQEKR